MLSHSSANAILLKANKEAVATSVKVRDFTGISRLVHYILGNAIRFPRKNKSASHFSERFVPGRLSAGIFGHPSLRCRP